MTQTQQPIIAPLFSLPAESETQTAAEGTHPLPLGTLVTQERRLHPRITGTVTDSQPTSREGHYRYTVAIEPEEYNRIFQHKTYRTEFFHMYSDDVVIA
jgi:hypothetical protein